MRAFVWLVALVALGAVAFFATQRYPALIEADLRQRTSGALSAAKLSFAKISVTGRVVTLSGEAPGLTAKEDAVKVAGDVWGVQQVNDALVVGAAAAQPVASQTVIGTAAQISGRPVAPAPPPLQKEAPAPIPPPAEPELPSTALPTVEAMVDPALAPPVDTVPPEPEPAPQPAEEPVEQKQVPARTATAIAPPAAAPAPPTPAPAPATPAPAPAIAQGVTAALTAGSAPPAPVAVEPPAYRLEAHVEGKRVELQGLVSTPSAQRALVAHVRRYIRRAQVVDSLTVAHAKPDSDWLGVARKGLSQLAHLDTGSLRLDGKTIEVSGRPKSDNDRARVLAALNELPKGYTSTVLLERMQDVAPVVPSVVAAAAAPTRPAPPVARKRVATAPKTGVARHRIAPQPVHAARSVSGECRHRFGDVLPRMAVIFESGSSRVQSSAGSALDEFARVARQCPGARIRLTGHSDTSEVPSVETRLSRQRALAVREALAARGVWRASIDIAGRGGTRPVFSNTTADGRENNRRVEFTIW